MHKNNWIVSYSQFLINRRWWVIAASLVLVVISASGMRFLEFTSDYRAFFSKENPQLKAFEELQNVYSKNDNVLFVLAPKDGQVFTRKTLATVEWLTREAWQLPYSSRVDSIANFQYTRADGDDLVVSDLIKDTESFSDADLERVKKIALDEPLLHHRLISPQTHVTGVNATIILPGKHLDEVPEVVAYARQLVAQVKKRDPDMNVYLTGVVLMNNAFPEAAFKDMGTLVPGMYVLVFVILFFLLRSITGTLGTLAVTFMSILTAMGLAGWLGIKLTPPSASAHIIILTLSIADCVHLMVTMFHDMHRGVDKRRALAESMRINMQPIFLTSLTTVVGFLSMNFSEVPPFHDLGNIVAMGVTVAFVYSITFFPAMMVVSPVHVKPQRADGAAMRRLAEFVIHRRRPLFIGMVMVIAFLAAFIPRNELNDQFVKYFDKSIAFRTDTDFVVENLTGIYAIEYSLGAGDADGINNPAYMQKLEEFANWYRTQPGVLHVNTLSDTMKRLNKNMHGDEPAWYRLPDNRQLAAQYLLLYEMSLPFGLDLNNQINVDKSATRLTVTLVNMTTKEVLGIEERAQQWLRANAPEAMFAHGASPTVMFSYIGARNIRSMLLGSSVALVVISLILVVALRSLKIGLVSLLPNLAPAGMAFGLWGIFVGEIGLSLSLVVAMTLGIVVDFTIHFLSKYLRARREKNLGSVDAVRYAFATVGTALWVTSMVLVAGFALLAFSAFKLNSGMGMLTAITIALALVADFLFLPPLLMKLARGGKNETIAVTDPAGAPASEQHGGNARGKRTRHCDGGRPA